MGVTPAHDRAQVVDLTARVPPHGHESHTGIHRNQHHNQVHSSLDHLEKARGAICFTFDDCYIQQVPVLEHMAYNGQRATIFANKQNLAGTTGYGLGHPTCMNLVDFVRFNGYGHEIGNHTKDHLDMTALTPAARATSLDTVTADFVAAGIPAPTSFAYPFGGRNYFSDRDLATRFRIFRYSGIQEFDRNVGLGMFRVGGTRILTQSATPSGLGDALLADAKALIRMAVSRPVIYCFFNHLGPTYTDELTVGEFISLLDYTKSLGVPCLTFREAFGTMNMAPNPSFEDDPSILVGWPHGLTSGAGTSTVATGQTPYVGGEGTQAMHLHTASGGDVAWKGIRVAVIPGETYWFSARLKLLNAGTKTSYATDTFTRSVVDDWGTASGGGAWTIRSGTAADFDVNGSVGTIACAASTVHYATHPMDADHADVDITASYTDDKTPSGNNMEHRVYFRWVDASNYMYATFLAFASGYGCFKLFKVVAGVITQIGSQITNNSASAYPYVPTNGTDKRWVRVAAVGTTVRLKWWLDSDEGERDYWQAVYTDSAMPTAAGKIGLGSATGAISNGPITTSWDNLQVNKAQGVTGSGVRLIMFALGSNTTTLPSTVFSSPVESLYYDLTESNWVQLALDGPVTVPMSCTSVELRFWLDGIAADAYIDHVVAGLSRSQPDGPLG